MSALLVLCEFGRVTCTLQCRVTHSPGRSDMPLSRTTIIDSREAQTSRLVPEREDKRQTISPLMQPPAVCEDAR